MKFESKHGRDQVATPMAALAPADLCLHRIQRPLVVELGSAGMSYKGEPEAELLLRSAKRHPEWLHLGIDISDLATSIPANVNHRKADFIEGLRSLYDASASVIVSRFALGYYSQSGKQIPLASPASDPKSRFISERQRMRPEVVDYTARVIDLCCRKLRPDGNIYIHVCRFTLPLLLESAQNSPRVRKIIASSFTEATGKAPISFWAKELATRGDIYRVKIRRFS